MVVKQFLVAHKFVFLAGGLCLLSGIGFFLHQPQVNSAPIPSDIASRDAKRITDLKQVQNELELYFYECGYYPGAVHATPPCGPYVANNTWDGVSAALIGSPAIGVANVPNDPTSGANYFYRAAPHGTGYVIGATLEDLANPVLTQSVHGIVYKTDCDSPAYCIQL